MSSRLNQYDRDEIRAAARAGVSDLRLIQEYGRSLAWIRRIKATKDEAHYQQLYGTAAVLARHERTNGDGS